MAYTLFDADVENISGLSDLPNTEEGYTSAEMKAIFDKAGKDIKAYLNGTLIPELDVGAAKGFVVTFPANATTYDFESVSYGLNANTVIFAQPQRSSQSLWNSCDIKCSAVATNKLSFTATTAPTSDVLIDVIAMN